ncbi:hypothetical protein [Staphylococcus hominis]|uniref:hypothetical protein n=1 Tax=Staphylococcus hominis TaxID=1290 RepID=UPI00066B1113|nr:hypothetical protein [Staphylococcus hominis]DAW19527.1 MAG TPA: hypothetical protein [Caudoviricetes sp.]MDS3888377.1 hypothetical protein [Staphylococcus hominis]OAO08802.1 hypothetical protein A3836_11610 [Staphylococcus hominis]QKW67931.1 hypothetical protein FOC56_09635 [Staphylococcus hominis]TBW90686.1 hypothetical protein EQ808_11410 [Staphylococcus hominis]
MSKKVIEGIKEGLTIFIIAIAIAIVLNILDLNIGYNRFWKYLGNLEIINIFDNKELNGLIILGFIIGVIVFLINLFSSDKEDED